MLVGAATAELPFEPGLAMAGFAARTAVSTGTHDPLSVQAIAVGDANDLTMLVVADLTSLSPEQAADVRRRISDATGMADHAITVAVTHTHAAPNMDPWMTTAATPSDVWDGTAETMVAVAVSAWERRRESTLLTAASTASLTVNRRREDGPRDETLHVLRFDGADGHTAAVVFSYACHPTVIGSENTLLSADWPGAARARVSEAYPDAVVMYVQGFCGDCNAGHSAHSSMDATAQLTRTPERAGSVGRRIGDDVIRIAAEALPATGSVRHDAVMHEWVWSAEDAESPVFPENPSPAEATLERLRGVWSKRLETMDAGEREQLRVTCFQWGDVLLVQAGGEPFCALGLEIRQLLPHLQVIPVGYANGVPGYLPYPAFERVHGGYEVAEAHVVYGRPSAVPGWYGEAVRDFALDFAHRHSL